MASPATPARNRAVDLSGHPVAPRQFPCDAARPHRPLFCGETSDWLALQPAEQAEVVLAAYQERLLPELTRIEKLLTRLAVEFGLEFCRIDELAVFFLDVAREIRNHVQALEAAVASPPKNTSPLELAVNHADMDGLIARLDSVTTNRAIDDNRAIDGQTSPCYVRLIAGLRECQEALAEMVDFESALSR